MGFRSTFTTQDYAIKWPEWFREKYNQTVYFPLEYGIISSKHECKSYSTWGELEADIQKAIDWNEVSISNLVLIWLHECGGITRVEISKDAIKYSEPVEWRRTERIQHDYCDGCSDIEKIMA